MQEAKILNRVIRATETGWEYESDQRHAEIILEQLGLADDKTKPLGTPGVEETTSKHGDVREAVGKLLTQEMASQYRAVVARAQYIAQDRSVIPSRSSAAG